MTDNHMAGLIQVYKNNVNNMAPEEHLDNLKNPNKEAEYYKILKTYQYLMEQMGLQVCYKKITSDYEKKKYKLGYTKLGLKLLYRSTMAWASLIKLEKIIKMIKKKNELLSMFIKRQTAR